MLPKLCGCAVLAPLPAPAAVPAAAAAAPTPATGDGGSTSNNDVPTAKRPPVGVALPWPTAPLAPAPAADGVAPDVAAAPSVIGGAAVLPNRDVPKGEAEPRNGDEMESNSPEFNAAMNAESPPRNEDMGHMDGDAANVPSRGVECVDTPVVTPGVGAGTGTGGMNVTAGASARPLLPAIDDGTCPCTLPWLCADGGGGRLWPWCGGCRGGIAATGAGQGRADDGVDRPLLLLPLPTENVAGNTIDDMDNDGIAVDAVEATLADAAVDGSDDAVENLAAPRDGTTVGSVGGASGPEKGDIDTDGRRDVG